MAVILGLEFARRDESPLVGALRQEAFLLKGEPFQHSGQIARQLPLDRLDELLLARAPFLHRVHAAEPSLENISVQTHQMLFQCRCH